MDKARLEEVVINLLNDLQSVASEDAEEISEATTPLIDLAFFDSLLGLEMTVALEEQLGIEIEAQTIFADSQTREPLSVSRIAERILQNYSGAAA